MKIALVMTNDWELFGDGSGDYFSLQHQPLLNLLEMLKEYNAKITIMAEVCQQFAFNQLANDHEFAKNISKSWESILKKVISYKSDVQLHIHPQWLGFKYHNDSFHLNMNNWSLADHSLDTINTLITTGKEYLEFTLQKEFPKIGRAHV